jgi:superfamily II DNA/RNA helicase
MDEADRITHQGYLDAYHSIQNQLHW